MLSYSNRIILFKRVKRERGKQLNKKKFYHRNQSAVKSKLIGLQVAVRVIKLKFNYSLKVTYLLSDKLRMAFYI